MHKFPNSRPSSLQPAYDRDEAIEAASYLATIRADSLQAELRLANQQLKLMKRSLSWRVMEPLRWVRALTLGRLPRGTPLPEAWEQWQDSLRAEGLSKAINRFFAGGAAKRKLLRHRDQASDPLFVPTKAQAAFMRRPARQAELMLRPCYLLIADLGLQQCTKYRVTQKAELLRQLGWTVRIVDWQDSGEALSTLQVATQVIFYRVPGTASVLSLIEEAKRLGLKPRWEIDDLLFNKILYRRNGNLTTLTFTERRGLYHLADLYLRALRACGRGIASTQALAREMHKIGIDDVVVLENALDVQTLSVAETLLDAPPPSKDGRISICYGSGSRAHDMDFRIAEAGLIAAMKAEPRLDLLLIGPLKISPDFAQFGARVQRRNELSYAHYLAELAKADIAIAPLEETIFNDCKSNIKFLEAAILALPSVCSPTDTYRRVIQSGENGLLARTPLEWESAILTLAHDPALRRTIAEKARETALGLYAPERILSEQASPLFGHPPAFVHKAPRVLQVNVFMAPRSFGGATIVVEALLKPLAAAGFENSVMTTRPVLDDLPDGALRYNILDTDVFSVVAGRNGATDNLTIARQIDRWMEAWDADLVHFHAIQEMGVGMARACQEKGIPYVISLHDCWWLSDTLFITRDDGQYHLENTDVPLAPGESTRAYYLNERRKVMRHALAGAAAILSPSEEHKSLYVRNGVPAERILINRNGFTWPSRPKAKREPGSKLRFGFVGGIGFVKGYELIRKALERTSRDDWELVLVDNTLNLGFPSIDTSEWLVKGSIRTVPAYNQAGLDDFYDQVDVLLFPSQWRESYGLTVREALSRDVWVVSTAPGGQAEEIEDGVNGTLIPIIDDPAPLQEAIESLLDQKDRFDHYVNPNKSSLPTYEDQALELATLYRSILQKPA
ncbi:glycosyltransferase [Asaia lannensis]|uniref:Glycosyltransferase n=2 Tax=Asaia TaxID=91914 RepID=A0ABT1CDA7_9PROT|nr:glycosyltransferase [Asaia lannensis]MCO6158840.1 glycosyltransferase [Asaia lannensis NBRC 102526]